MIFPKDPMENLAYTARRSGLWVPMPLRYGAQKCCCDCHWLQCTCSDWPLEWICDLGAGGWTNDRCDACVDVKGEFCLTDGSGEPGVTYDCLCNYGYVEWCTTIWGLMSLYIYLAPICHIDHYHYDCGVSLANPSTTLFSAGFFSPERPLWDTCPTEATLSKVWDDGPYNTLGICGGALPDTITVTAT